MQAAVRVLLRDRDDEAQIGLDEFLLRLLGLPFPALYHRQHPVRGRRRPPGGGEALALRGPEIAQALPETPGIVQARPRRPALERPVSAIDLPRPLRGLAAGLDAVDESPPHVLRELDSPDAPRQPDPRPERPPAKLAIPPLVALRGLVEGLLRFARLPLGLGHGVHLLQQITRAAGDAIVGEVVLLQDHQIANAVIAGLQLLPELHDELRDGGRARHGPDDRPLAVLDALGDRHLALASQERHRAHLSQVHADGVVRLVRRARAGEIGLRIVAPLGGAFEPLPFVVLLLGLDDLDAGGLERAEQVVEILRRRHVRRQALVDFFEEEEALFLADENELANLVRAFLDGRQPGVSGTHATLCVRHGPDCIWHRLIVRSGSGRAPVGGPAAAGAIHASLLHRRRNGSAFVRRSGRPARRPRPARRARSPADAAPACAATARRSRWGGARSRPLGVRAPAGSAAAGA